MNFLFLSFFTVIIFLNILKEISRLNFIWHKFPLLMQFIPTWSFFAPIPNMYDYHLMYRKISNDGTVHEWEQANSFPEKRSFYSFLWNPDKRPLKSLLDISIELLQLSNKVKNKDQICLSVPYLQILNYFDSLHQDHFIGKMQFLIMGNSRSLKYEILFLSNVHPLSSSL